MRRRSVLLGRKSERHALELRLQAARAGQSAVLILRGEAGVGKTALLEHLQAGASGFCIARATGVQSEMELPFAGLHQLFVPMLDRLDRLPGPQRDALATAFWLRAGAEPNRLVVALAALSLLSEVAEDQPVLCIVDDAQWLDRASAQVLGLVARRLLAESVALVFTTREPIDELAGLPELAVEGLRHADALALLESAIPGPSDELVRERIVAETRGNPLALLELPRGLTPAELAGLFGLPEAPGLPGRIEDSYRRRVEAFPAPTRRLLEVAAAEPVGEPVLVRRAAERLGIGVEAATPATKAGLLEFGARVRFCHPLARSAVYRAASPGDWQRAHGALAEATDPEVDPDRRAWHLAHATPGPDEEVARELGRSASRARARGGIAAAAAFLERATELTPDPARRAERALAAAQAKLHAGAPDAARMLLAAAEVGPLDELQRARLNMLQGDIAFSATRGGDAAAALLEAARQLEPLHPTLARDAYLKAFCAASFAGRLAGEGGRMIDVAQAARAARRAGNLPPARDTAGLLLDGHAVMATEGFSAAAPLLRRAVSAARSDGFSADRELTSLWLACRAAMLLRDDESLYELAARYVQLARDSGALTVLPVALHLQALCHVLAGDLATAELMGDEARAVSAAIAHPGVFLVHLFLAAWYGREAETLELLAANDRDAAARGEGWAITAGRYTSVVLYNGLGRYALALTAAQQADEGSEDLGRSSWVLPELVEAASRGGRPELAADALRRLSEDARASGTDWALGIEARSRALLSEDDHADKLYREAIERLARTRIRSELARAHLLYGEWLRRENRRVDAREQLRTAHEMLTAIGAEAFAERAAIELQATGETARKRTVSTLDELTPQEARIARLARDGASNQDIASRLFISHKTVEYHLHKVFAKLRISSRTDLAGVLPIA